MSPKKSEEDRAVEDRIRAHIRKQLLDRGITRAEAARRIHYDKTNFNRILAGERGIGLGFILRVCSGLKMTASHLLEESPPPRFFDPDIRLP